MSLVISLSMQEWIKVESFLQWNHLWILLHLLCWIPDTLNGMFTIFFRFHSKLLLLPNYNLGALMKGFTLYWREFYIKLGECWSSSLKISIKKCWVITDYTLGRPLSPKFSAESCIHWRWLSSADYLRLRPQFADLWYDCCNAGGG